MYNLQKAKQEIDTVATHTGELISYVIAAEDGLQAKLDRFKAEMLDAIGARFAELEAKILGSDHANFETSAVTDLGSRVASLTQRSAPPHSVDHPEHHGDYDR